MSKNETSINSLQQDFNTDPPKKSKISDNLNKEITLPQVFKSKKLWLSLLVLLILGVSGYFGVNYFLSQNKNEDNESSVVVDNTKKDDYEVKDINLGDADTTDFPNLINGRYLTEENYNTITNRKPVAVMINNHLSARPQAGISQADVIYEVVAEGGISRLLAVFHSSIPDRVGPIRSARIYYMQVAAEYWPIFSNWGWAHRPPYELGLSDAEFQELLAQGAAETDPRADARGYIDEIAMPTANVDTTPEIFYREDIPNVALEHTGYMEIENVYESFKQYYPEPSWSEFQEFELWTFKDARLENTSSSVNKISYNFWDMPGFKTTWTYNADSNSYTRSQGGEVTTDRNTEEPIEVKNVVVQYAAETKLNDKKNHLLYDVIGSGNSTVYLDGTKIEGTWEKTAARERTIFYDAQGNEVEFNRGLFWITVLPTYSEVSEE